MRVLHVITRLIVGGAQENTIASVLGLRARHGVDARLISGPTTGPEGSLASQVQPPELLAIAPHLCRAIHPLSDFLAYRELLAIFRRERPDIVHTHSAKAGFLGRLATDRVHVPIVIHTLHGPSFGPFQGPLANLAFRTAELNAARFTHHFVSVADAMTRQYLAAGIGRPEQFTTIRSGFDLDPFLNATNDPTLRRQLGLSPDDFVVGKIARLFRLKGHDDVFAVAPNLIRAHPKLRFLFVGDGEWRGRFEQTARDLGLEKHFIFKGLVPPTEVPRYVGIMDALVHLSLREGLARALPQALAAGKPVVAYDCDGAREVCLDGQSGFLIAPGDRATLSARLGELAKQPVLRQRLGAAGRELVRRQFSVEQMVDELNELYVRLANRQKSEVRSPKSEGSPKSEIRKAGVGGSLFRISGFGFPSDFGFRASDFFRPSLLPTA
jgi:glycosyltransferase involved in cell wall biosynthesis